MGHTRVASKLPHRFEKADRKFRSQL